MKSFLILIIFLFKLVTVVGFRVYYRFPYGRKKNEIEANSRFVEVHFQNYPMQGLSQYFLTERITKDIVKREFENHSALSFFSSELKVRRADVLVAIYGNCYSALNRLTLTLEFMERFAGGSFVLAWVEPSFGGGNFQKHLDVNYLNLYLRVFLVIKKMKDSVRALFFGKERFLIMALLRVLGKLKRLNLRLNFSKILKPFISHIWEYFMVVFL